MHEVISTDRQCISVTGYHPDAQFWIRRFYARGNRRCSSVNRVKPVCVHIIWESGRAADPRDENDLFARDTQFGHHFLNIIQDRIVAASWAPTNLLARNKIRFGQLVWWWRGAKRHGA